MRRIIATAALSLASLATFTAPAHAAPTIVGTTCGFLTVDNETVTGQNGEGFVIGATVAADTGLLGENPVDVRMTCTVLVNGDPVTIAESIVNVGAAAVVSRAQVAAGDTDDVKVCTRIVATSASGTTTYSGCAETTTSDVPPQELCDLLPGGCPVGVRLRYAIPAPVVR